jgi:hypothetical protein
MIAYRLGWMKQIRSWDAGEKAGKATARRTRRRRVGIMSGRCTQVKIPVASESAAAFKNACNAD